MEPYALVKKSFKLVWRCYQLLSRFLAKARLPRVSRHSRSVVNNKGDNEMIPEAVHRSPGICLTAEENPRKPRKPSDEGAVRPVISSNGVLFFQMRSVGSHSTSGREKEGNKERMGWEDRIGTGVKDNSAFQQKSRFHLNL